MNTGRLVFVGHEPEAVNTMYDDHSPQWPNRWVSNMVLSRIPGATPLNAAISVYFVGF